MDKTYVVWKTYHSPEILGRGYWDQGLLEDLFKQGNFEHVTNVSEVPIGEGDDRLGAVVVINGRTHVEDTAKLTEEIAPLKWVLFIETGDEESVFPWREVKHPLMRVWMMLPRMNVHDDVHFKLPNGYRPNTREIMKEIGYKEKDIDWSFVGQVNHERRQQCFDVLTQFKPLYPKSVLVGTNAFGKEVVPYREYIQIMAESKIVLCPSGVESPDNFRLYEALEAGAIPVVDAFSTNFKTAGFWRYLFGDDIPFPIVNYWDEIPDMLPHLIANHKELSQKCFAWWQLKKREMKFRLFDDIKELSR
jgi:hypothetical protein